MKLEACGFEIERFAKYTSDRFGSSTVQIQWSRELSGQLSVDKVPFLKVHKRFVYEL